MPFTLPPATRRPVSAELQRCRECIHKPTPDQHPKPPQSLHRATKLSAQPPTQARPYSRHPSLVADSRRYMNDLIDSDGFRANVGIILMRGDGEVFLGRRTGGRGWQFPQGGVRVGELPEEAVYRELHEEIGVSRTDVELVGRTTRWLRYRLPARFVRRNQRPVCI